SSRLLGRASRAASSLLLLGLIDLWQVNVVGNDEFGVGRWGLHISADSGSTLLSGSRAWILLLCLFLLFTAAANRVRAGRTASHSGLEDSGGGRNGGLTAGDNDIVCGGVESLLAVGRAGREGLALRDGSLISGDTTRVAVEVGGELSDRAELEGGGGGSES